MNPSVKVVTLEIDGSQIISKLSYAVDTKKLFVVFKKTNTTWAYNDVPAEVFCGFFDAESLGSYFSSAVRNKFDSFQVSG